MELQLHTVFPDHLESDWDALLTTSTSHVPFLRYGYLELWWQTRGGGEWPQAELTIVTAHQDGKLVGVAPLFYTPDYHGRPCLMLLGSVEISDYLDLIAHPADMPGFLAALFPFLHSNRFPRWEALDFLNILDTSPTLSMLSHEADQMGWSYCLEFLQHSPYIKLPGDWETYLSGIDKKQRHEIRRKMRRIDELGVPVRWYFVEDMNTADQETEAYLTLMLQDPKKVGFLTPAMRQHMHLTTRWALENRFLRMAFLEINYQKAAVYLAFDYLNSLWLYNSGIDWIYNDYSPGWVLLGNLLKWANEQKYEMFDFLRGNEDYKYRFGSIDRNVVRVVIVRD
jgi:CelD/BcsL family acetyltransferase involved in cellulose biosynthesis